QAGSLQAGAEQGRGACAHSASRESRGAAGLLRCSDRRRHGGHGSVSAAASMKKSTLAGVESAEQHVLLPTYDRYKVLLRKGKGVYLYDADGNRYLDFLTGIGVNALGYAHPAVTKAIREQTATGLLHVSNLFYHDYQAKLAQKLAKISGMDRAFFTN